eukprot:4408798-Prymnesium_polylepis.1
MLTAGSPHAAGAAGTPCCRTCAVHAHGGLEAREVGGRRAVRAAARNAPRETKGWCSVAVKSDGKIDG